MQSTWPLPAAVPEHAPAPIPRRRAIGAVTGALLLGGLTQALVWHAHIGLGWFCADVLLVAAMLATFPRKRRVLGNLVAGAAVALGGAIAWRASIWSLSVAAPAMIVLLFLLPFVLRWEADVDGAAFLVQLWSGIRRAPPAVVTAAQMPALALHGAGRARAKSLLRGIALGIPISLTFVALLSADPAFAHALARGGDGVGELGGFVLWSGVTAALFLVVYVLHAVPGATCRGAAPVRPYRTPEFDGATFAVGTPSPRVPLVRPATWGVVVAQVALAFGVFAVVNAPRLFGGHAYARAAGTVTYAQYLHAGFLQLSLATVLAVVTVVVGHRLMRDRSWPDARVPGGRPLAALEVTLLALAAVALASCAQRLRIYQDAYGYTYLRLGVAVCQLVVLALIGLTIWKAATRAFRGYALGVALVGLAAIVAAAWFDADLYVARGNVARAADAQAGTGSEFAWRELDVEYLSTLSRDARPVLDDAFFASRPDLAGALRQAWAGPEGAGWRSKRGIAAGP